MIEIDDVPAIYRMIRPLLMELNAFEKSSLIVREAAWRVTSDLCPSEDE